MVVHGDRGRVQPGWAVTVPDTVAVRFPWSVSVSPAGRPVALNESVSAASASVADTSNVRKSW